MVAKYFASWEIAIALTPSSGWLSKMVRTGILWSKVLMGGHSGFTAIAWQIYGTAHPGLHDGEGFCNRQRCCRT